MSLWSHSIFPAELEPGDHIYYYQVNGTTHHGIFIGQYQKKSNGTLLEHAVVHLCTVLPTPKILVHDLSRFLADGKHQLRKARYDEGWYAYLKFRGTSYPFQTESATQVIERAISSIGKCVPDYSIVKNCEAFAVYCKTGKGCSAQGSIFGLLTLHEVKFDEITEVTFSCSFS